MLPRLSALERAFDDDDSLAILNGKRSASQNTRSRIASCKPCTWIRAERVSEVWCTHALRVRIGEARVHWLVCGVARGSVIAGWYQLARWAGTLRAVATKDRTELPLLCRKTGMSR